MFCWDLFRVKATNIVQRIQSAHPSHLNLLSHLSSSSPNFFFPNFLNSLHLLFDFFIFVFLFNPLCFVKNYERSEISSSLQANHLTCYSFMEAGRRRGALQSKGCIPHGTASSASVMFSQFPCPQVLPGATWCGSGE